MTPNDCTIGDYSREQHERICQLEGQLKAVIRLLKTGDKDSLSFAQVTCEDVIEQGAVYHVSYPHWLEKMRGQRPDPNTLRARVLERASIGQTQTSAIYLMKAYKELSGCTVAEARDYVFENFPEYKPRA